MADLIRRPVPQRTRLARQHDRGPRVEYLAFELAGEPYAAPVALVREILKPPPLTPVPRAPHAILGIISVRGQLVTVLDLRRRLRLPESPPSRKARILLVEGDIGEMLGLFVDEVLQVYRFSESEIEHAALALGNDVAPYIAGIARPATVAATSHGTPPAPGSVGTPHTPGSLGTPHASGPAGAGPSVRRDPEGPVIILLDLRAVLL